MEMVTLNSAKAEESRAQEELKREVKQLNLDLAVKPIEAEEAPLPLMERNNPEERQSSPKAGLQPSESMQTQIYQSPLKGHASSQGIYEIQEAVIKEEQSEKSSQSSRPQTAQKVGSPLKQEEGFNYYKDTPDGKREETY